jgi:hypothetical protein
MGFSLPFSIIIYYREKEVMTCEFTSEKEARYYFEKFIVNMSCEGHTTVKLYKQTDSETEYAPNLEEIEQLV